MNRSNLIGATAQKSSHCPIVGSLGTNAITAGTPITNTFTVPYAYAPIINVEGSTTNGVAITGITTTGFIMSSAVTQAVGWGALGISATPGASAVTY